MFEFNPFGYVNEGTSGKYCAVQSREFVVSRGNDFSKPGAEDIFMVFQAFRGVDEDDALAAEFLLHVGVGGFGVVLGFHARQKLACSGTPRRSKVRLTSSGTSSQLRLGRSPSER